MVAGCSIRFTLLLQLQALGPVMARVRGSDRKARHTGGAVISVFDPYVCFLFLVNLVLLRTSACVSTWQAQALLHPQMRG